MIMLTAVFFFAGVIVGFRFKAFVLVPLLLIASSSIVVFEGARGEASSAIIASAFLAAAGLQIGYLCSSFARTMSTTSRAGRAVYRRPKTINVEEPT